MMMMLVGDEGEEHILDQEGLDEDGWARSWGDLEVESERCDCPVAPRQFLIPPPPPPPGGSCRGGGAGEPLFCRLEPLGAELSRAAFPSLPVIAVCSSVVLVAVLVASFLLWRHKTKVQNLLPCKHDQQGRCDLAAANGVTYEDVLINHHPTRLPPNHISSGQTLMPIELLDVKLGDIGPPEIPSLHRGAFYPCREGGQVLSGKHFHPVYEEVSREPSAGKSVTKSYESDIEESGRGGRSFTSEDDFAEDELSGIEYPSGDGSRHCSATSSVQGSTGGDLCRDPASSDEGTGEDSDYMIHSLPGMLTIDNAFNYPRKNLQLPCIQDNMDTPTDSIIRDQGMVQKLFHPNVTPSSPDRTGNDPLRHSKQNPLSHMGHAGLPVDNKQHTLSPSHVMSPCSTFISPTNSKNSSTLPPLPQNSQWTAPFPSVLFQESQEALHSPTCNQPEVENIYSTIDEGEAVESILCPTTASRAQTVQPSVALPKRNPTVPKKLVAQGERQNASSQLSQRSNEEESESYGDIMPAFSNTTSFI